jgi:hypothetical protein
MTSFEDDFRSALKAGKWPSKPIDRFGIQKYLNVPGTTDSPEGLCERGVDIAFELVDTVELAGSVSVKLVSNRTALQCRLTKVNELVPGGGGDLFSRI